MKLKHILLPISTLSIAPIAMVSCGEKALVPIRTDYLKIENNTLTGVDTTKDFKDFNCLSVPKTVITVDGFADEALETKAILNSIKTISYEENSKWREIGTSDIYGFSNLHSVETIIFPNTIESMVSGAFTNLPKLSTIDITSYYISPLWLKPNGFESIPNTGKFIVANNTVKSYIERIMLVDSKFSNWTVQVK